MKADSISRWFDRTFLELGRQFRWSYLPPLMVYFAAGVSALTAIVGTFFVKEYLDLPAAFIAGLAFWAGIPWVLKMPLGHLVDLIWRWTSLLSLSRRCSHRTQSRNHVRPHRPHGDNDRTSKRGGLVCH